MLRRICFSISIKSPFYLIFTFNRFSLLIKMSLLDQLSSLCAQNSSSSYQSSFFSFNLDNASSCLPSLPANPPVTAQKPEPSSETKNSQIHHSQQKMIKLFDDEELKPTWKLIKTDKKSNSKPTVQSLNEKNLSQFTVDQPKKDNQTIFTHFTKIFHIFNTKLRKFNYEFFVRLEKYSKAVLKQKALQQEEMRKMKFTTMERGFKKLDETLKIINLKYFQTDSEQSSNLNVKSQKKQAFSKIRFAYLISKKLLSVEKCFRKNIYRHFIGRLQQRNKTAIKLDLFVVLMESIMKRKFQENSIVFFQVLNQHEKSAKIIENEKTQYFQARKMVQTPQTYERCQINMNVAYPLGYYVQKAYHPQLALEKQLNLQVSGAENIPLKLHNLKSHDQQTNLNDCIDNGHLLMNQMKNNTSFRQELDNLTISNINSKTSNTSANLSLLGYEHLIQPAVRNEDKEEFISYRAITMRKQSRPSQDVTPASEQVLGKQVKKSRKSLVITKRKESANDILGYAQVMATSEKQKISFDPKKPKSTTTSSSKIGQKQSNGDKEVIKRMLDQLNKKFSCDDKIIKISLSNKKQTSNAKKEKTESSGKNLDRKKIRSEMATVTIFNQKMSKKQAEKKSAQKQTYRIDLTQKKEEEKKAFYQEKKKSKSKNSQNCFMSVTLNKNHSNGQASNQQKPGVDHGKLIQQRTKQSHSEMSKKNQNSKYPSQISQQSEICRILSKYRSKKPSIPECCMKIDLVTSKVNKVLNLAEKNNQRNKIFFNNNDSSLDRTQDYQLQGGLNDIFGDANLSVSKTYSRPSNDSYMMKRNSMNHLSGQTDNVMGEYVSMLPSNICMQENQQEADCVPYGIEKPGAANTSLDASECFFTGPKARLSSKPNSMNSSMDKKRASFEKNLQEWDMMFEKQKSKFLKNDKNLPKRKSTLNEQVISEIKHKIEQCLILGNKDTNVSKGPYLQLKKGSQEKNVNQDKNAVMSTNNTVKMLSSSNSNRNSINRLQTTNKLAKRMEI